MLSACARRIGYAESAAASTGCLLQFHTVTSPLLCPAASISATGSTAIADTAADCIWLASGCALRIGLQDSTPGRLHTAHVLSAAPGIHSSKQLQSVRRNKESARKHQRLCSAVMEYERLHKSRFVSAAPGATWQSSSSSRQQGMPHTVCHGMAHADMSCMCMPAMLPTYLQIYQANFVQQHHALHPPDTTVSPPCASRHTGAECCCDNPWSSPRKPHTPTVPSAAPVTNRTPAASLLLLFWLADTAVVAAVTGPPCPTHTAWQEPDVASHRRAVQSSLPVSSNGNALLCCCTPMLLDVLALAAVSTAAAAAAAAAAGRKVACVTRPWCPKQAAKGVDGCKAGAHSRRRRGISKQSRNCTQPWTAPHGH
jgi:hypothetical protein